MHPSFSFEDAGRVFACHVAQAQTRDITEWWWFTVSSDSHRYAPFHADAGDTEDSVRSRVVAYYDALLSQRSAPRQPWRRPDRPTGTPTAAPGSNDAASPTNESPTQPT